MLRNPPPPTPGIRPVPASRAWPVVAALGLALLLALGALSGCEHHQRHTTADESLARAIAVVNNEKVLYEDFLNQYQLFLTKWDAFIQNDPKKKQQIKELLLQRVIDEKLIDQEARRKGIDVDDAELNKRSMALLTASNDSDTGSLDAGTTETELPPDVMAQWSRELRRRMIQKRVVQQEVLDKIRITPAEMRAYYDQHRKEFYRPERVKVRHIAVGSRQLYNRVMSLLARGHDFVELAHQYSITPDRMNGGELGYVQRGVLPPAFDKAIFKMTRIGSITPANDPVHTEMGYHIFKLEGREPAGQLSFRDALPEIRERLLRQKEPGAYQRWLADLRAKATIVIDQGLLHAE